MSSHFKELQPIPTKKEPETVSPALPTEAQKLEARRAALNKLRLQTFELVRLYFERLPAIRNILTLYQKQTHAKMYGPRIAHTFVDLHSAQYLPTYGNESDFYWHSEWKGVTSTSRLDLDVKHPLHYESEFNGITDSATFLSLLKERNYRAIDGMLLRNLSRFRFNTYYGTDYEVVLVNITMRIFRNETTISVSDDLGLQSEEAVNEYTYVSVLPTHLELSSKFSDEHLPLDDDAALIAALTADHQKWAEYLAGNESY